MTRPAYRLLWLCMALLWVNTAHATCNLTGKAYLHTGVEAAILKLRFGHINLTDSTLQPYGSLLGKLAVPATDYIYRGADADTVLWECDKEDLDNIQFLVATNADWEFGGWHEVGMHDGLDGVFATAFKNVGLRLRMEGVTLTGIWKPVPVKTYQEYPEKRKNPVTGKMKDRIGIRVQDVPVMEAELYKVQGVVPSGYNNYGCHGSAADNKPRHLYQCFEPNGNIQLDAPGLQHDKAGDDALYHYRYYGSNNGLAWGMYHAISLSNVNTCVVKSATPHVHFDPITVQQLNEGGAAWANFSVEVNCNDNQTIISGTDENKTAIGLQVPPAAFDAAKALGLVNPHNGVAYLLPEQSTPQMAGSVGIQWLAQDEDGPRMFVGQPGSVGTGFPQGPDAGWYPLAKPMGTVTCNTARYKCYRLDFTARLVKLPTAQEVTPGKVRARAHVLVRVQ